MIANAHAGDSCSNGMSDTASAAPAAVSATTSGSTSGSTDNVGDDDLNVVAETIREQRPDGPVDQARREGRLLRWAAFALDKTAGNFAGGVHALFVIASEWEKIDAFARIEARGCGDEDAGVAVASEIWSRSLDGQAHRFQV